MSSKLNIPYSELKNIINGKNLAWQFTESTPKYHIFAVDGNVIYQTEVWKSGKEPRGLDIPQNGADRADFEANYKDISNKTINPRTVDGLPKILAAVSPDDVSLYITGKSIAVESVSSKYVDSNFVEEVQLQGMVVFVKGAEWGDSITVEVGYVENGEWVPVKVFGDNVPMKDEANWQEHHYKNNAVSVITTNLKVRTKLNTANPTGKKLMVHYVTHK